MWRSKPKRLNSLEASQKQLLATLQPLALKHEPGSRRTSKMIKYENQNSPKLLQPNGATEFCDYSKTFPKRAFFGNVRRRLPENRATRSAGAANT
jgi:hypothetical protein